MKRWYFTSLISLAIFGAAAAQTFPTTSPAATSMNAQVLSTLLRDLSSDDFRIREAAQAKLRAMPLSQRDVLQRLADGVTDAEIKARLQMRVDEMDEQVALAPPPLSLDVKNATLTEVAAALNNALSGTVTVMPLEVQKIGLKGDDRFTLHVEKQPFWKIIAQLDQQHPLAIGNSVNGMTLGQATGGIHQLRVMPGAGGSFAIHVNQAMATAGGQVRLFYEFLADPRLRVTQSASPRFTQVVDEKGVPVTLTRSIDGELVSSLAAPRKNVHPWTMVLEPAAAGSIIDVKGEAQFLVQVKDQVVVIESPEKHLNEPVSAGFNTVTVKRFADAPDFSVRLELNVAARPAETARGAPVSREARWMQIALVDSAGTRLWTRTMWTGTISQTVTLPFKAPLKLLFITPAKSREITLPFELKGVPLP